MEKVTVEALIEYHKDAAKTVAAYVVEAYAGDGVFSNSGGRSAFKYYTARARWHDEAVALCEGMATVLDGYESPEHAAQVADTLSHQCNTLQQRLTAAEQRAALLERVMRDTLNDEDGLFITAEFNTGPTWSALQKHGRSIEAALKPAAEGGEGS